MTLQLIDISRLLDFADGDESFVNDMLQAFVNNTPESMTLLKSLFDEGNWVDLGVELHKIKPTFKYLSVDAVESKIIEAENLCKTVPNPQRIGELLEEILSLSGKVLEEANLALHRS